MKILLICTNASESGAPKHVESIINGLGSTIDFKIVFGERGPVSDRLIDLGYDVYIINEMNSKINICADIVAFFKLIKIIFKIKPDIVHLHSSKAGLLGRLSALFLGIPWVYTVHGWGWRGMSKIQMMLIIRIEKILAKIKNGKFIYVADAVMNDAINILGIPSDRGVLIYNGVAQIKIMTRNTDDGYNIMMPARVCSAKDHLSMISAFEKYCDFDSRLLLCGEGTDTPEFISMAKRIAPQTFPLIKFYGQVSNIGNLIEKADVVCLISLFEALPLSIIEAMSCSKAIIATNVGGVAELINDHDSGILVNRMSVDEIVAALKFFKSEYERVRYGMSAKKKYLSNFTDSCMNKSIETIYSTLYS